MHLFHSDFSLPTPLQDQWAADSRELLPLGDCTVRLAVQLVDTAYQKLD
jgi:hypothetical protein